MATYLELFDLRSNDVLKNKIAIAALIKAQLLIDGATPTPAQITWANNTIANPEARSMTLLNYILAANSGLNVAQIESASDTAVQNQVNPAVDALILGGAE